MRASPRVQNHVLTQESVTIALHTLGLAKDASVVARGIDIWRDFRNTPQAAAKAAQFLVANPVEKRGSISQAFWTLFEVLASDATGHSLGAKGSVSQSSEPPRPSDAGARSKSEAASTTVAQAESVKTEATRGNTLTSSCAKAEQALKSSPD